MKIFVTGATGFTGSQVVPLLLQNGYEIRCLHRQTSDRSLLSNLDVEWTTGDLSDTQALSSSMQAADILVNIASLGFGHADNIIAAAKKVGIKRAVFISTTAIFTQLNAGSKNIRLAAETAIQSSGLDFTILRPTMIYGSPRDRNIWRLIRFLRLSPVIPIFGDGESLQQPIFVGDVAQAVIGSLASEKTIRKSYNIAGAYALTYNQVIDTIAATMHKHVWKVHFPSAPIVGMLKLLERIHIPFPIKAEQVLRLNENKAFSYEEAQMDFGFRPRSFAEGIGVEVGLIK